MKPFASGRLQAAINARWYEDARPPGGLLRLLSRAYGAVADYRGRRQRQGVAALPLPVVVVGNLSAGGAGKTPLTLALAELAAAAGLRVGIVSRGYGGRLGAVPHRVDAGRDTAEAVGDEPLLMARRLPSVPVCVARRRDAGVRQLAAGGGLDLVLADDGLQHYRLPRVAEVCVLDGRRGLGNGWRLPAGPLREPESRLADCDLVVVNGPGARGDLLQQRWQAARFDLRLGPAQRLADGGRVELAHFAGGHVHALAGIGHPQRFFDALAAAGMTVLPHPRADHAPLAAAGCDFGDALPVLMTEKDAIKLQPPYPANGYAVPVQAVWRDDGAERAEALLRRAAGQNARLPTQATDSRSP